MYNVVFTPKALKDVILLERSGLIGKAEKLLNIIETNPFQNPPPYKKNRGYDNRYSRRINIQHRIFYEIYGDFIKVISMWDHDC
jgi:Txe/YoeB family toxin of toxin-antitoxin system